MRTDYHAVTGFSSKIQKEVRQSFLQGIALEADRDLAPVVTLIGIWSMAKGREAAVVTACRSVRTLRRPGGGTDFVAAWSQPGNYRRNSTCLVSCTRPPSVTYTPTGTCRRSR